MRPLLIGVVGGSGSGKTTVARAIYDSLPLNAAFIDMDAYYRDLSHLTLEERKEINFDHPDAFDLDYMVAQLSELQAGRPIRKPTYDFAAHTRAAKSVEVLPRDVIVVDGILLFVEERLRSRFDIKVYVDVDDDVRFIRRLQRDVTERGRDMDDVIRQGRTVLFVSHSLGIIQNLCERGILLQNGMIAIDDTMSEAINAYLQTLEQMSFVDLLERGDRKGQGKVRLVGLEITDGINGASSPLQIGGLARFVLHVNAILPDINCTVSFYDHIGHHITTFDSKVRSQDDMYGPKNSLMFICELDELFLMPGRYRVDVALVGDNCIQDFVPAAAFFDVTEGTRRGRPTPRTENIRQKTFSAWMPHRWTLPCKD